MAVTANTGRRDAANGSVVVVHPGVQHSRELVRALHEGDLLSRFITSDNGTFANARWLPQRVRAASRARFTEGVPPDRVCTIPWTELALRFTVPIARGRLQERLAYVALSVFDRLAAGRVLSAGPRIVVGFENSCLHTFRRARESGALCVLDAASVHYAAQPRDGSARQRKILDSLNRRKDEEVRLANHVVVLSQYARDTYVAAGVPLTSISIVPPGVDQHEFRRHEAEKAASGVRLLFVGNIKRAKGIDLMLDAFEKLEIVGKCLEIAGSLVEPDALPARLPAGVKYLGKLDRPTLAEAYARADLLVQPSRADGFSFVVAEAMASAMPVIVSSAVGAKDFVVDGHSGWIFESGSAAGLRDAIARAIDDRREWPVMGERARGLAEGLSWARYRERTQAVYRALLERAGPVGSAP